MPATIDEVRMLVTRQFRGADATRLTMGPDSRINGPIISPEFQGMDHIRRNQLINQRVRDPLGLRGYNLGVLYPVAPGEPI